MAFTPLAGSNGRVRMTGADTVVAGIRAWKIQKQTGEVETTNFESTQDANSVIQATFLSDNISNSTVNIEGIFDTGSPNSESYFNIGTTVIVDLFFNKAATVGYANLGGFVKSFEAGTELKGAQTFTATVRLTGTVGAST